jgi:predicted small lipoprotein YifL
MKQLLSAIIILTLLSSCGVKRPLELPCHVKRHKADEAQQSDKQPCDSQQAATNGQALPPAAPVQATTTSGQK